MTLSVAQKPPAGFTIVELLIVIVVIGILAAITIVSFNGVQSRAADARRASDVAAYTKAITAARQNTGNVLMTITGSSWSLGNCAASSGNLGNVEPRDLPKTHNCWLRYYDNLTKIGDAAGIKLDALKAGDARGNPYMLDENEGEMCSSDAIVAFTGSGAAVVNVQSIPRMTTC